MSVYDADGRIRTTSVVGNVYTGIYAADGSINVVVDDATHTGLYHPCGAFRVNSGTGTSTYDESGAYYSNHVMGMASDAAPLTISYLLQTDNTSFLLLVDGTSKLKKAQ